MNQYIPVGVIHALENTGRVPLELIEIQSGSYLGKYDIVRFEDQYGGLNENLNWAFCTLPGFICRPN